MTYNDFITVLHEAIDAPLKNKDLALNFLSGNDKFQFFIVGKNDESLFLINNFKISGIIDDFTFEKSWNNTEVFTSSSIPLKSIVVNCSTSISPISVEKNLRKSGIKNLISFSDLSSILPNKIPFPKFIGEMREEIKSNNTEWYKIYCLLADKKSQELFINLICYRLTGNIYFMKGQTVRLNEQYFEDFMKYKDEVFVDIGGYDGDTSEEFTNRYPDYMKIILFEPSKSNMAKAKDRLINVKNIEYFEYGVSDSIGTLSFNSDLGSSSSVSSDGDTTINVTTIDEQICEPVSVIKMDIEGWEIKALIGSQNHIKQDHPKLAIAVYHSAADFYLIPKYILSLNSNYYVYLRHYTEGWSETIMYFVPKD